MWNNLILEHRVNEFLRVVAGHSHERRVASNSACGKHESVDSSHVLHSRGGGG